MSRSSARYPLPDLASLVEALDRGDTPLAVGGVVPGARSLAVASLVDGGWKPRIAAVVVPHVAEVDDLAAGLELLAPGLGVGRVPGDLCAPALRDPSPRRAADRCTHPGMPRPSPFSPPIPSPRLKTLPSLRAF